MACEADKYNIDIRKKRKQQNSSVSATYNKSNQSNWIENA